MKFNPERIVRNVVPDILDNIPSENPPPILSRHLESPEAALPLSERLLPREIQANFFNQTAELEPGDYRARVAVGEIKEGTRHPHDYIIQKDAELLRMYFVDPEHQMGASKNRSVTGLPRTGDLIRPKMSTLIGIQMSPENIVPEISMLRYRTAAITDPRLLKMSAQLEIAKQILATGEVPDILRYKENEITFRLNVRPDELLGQSRYAKLARSNAAKQEALKRFLNGEPTSSAIEGKIHAFCAIMRHFTKLLTDKRFSSIS